MDRETFEKTLRVLGMEFEMGGDGLEHYIQNNLDYVSEHSAGEWNDRVAEERIKYLEGE